MTILPGIAGRCWIRRHRGSAWWRARRASARPRFGVQRWRWRRLPAGGAGDPPRRAREGSHRPCTGRLARRHHGRRGVAAGAAARREHSEVPATTAGPPGSAHAHLLDPRADRCAGRIGTRVLLGIDDAQWVDAESGDVLAALVTAARPAPAGVLITARSGGETYVPFEPTSEKACRHRFAYWCTSAGRTRHRRVTGLKGSGTRVRDALLVAEVRQLAGPMFAARTPFRPTTPNGILQAVRNIQSRPSGEAVHGAPPRGVPTCGRSRPRRAAATLTVQT